MTCAPTSSESCLSPTGASSCAQLLVKHCRACARVHLSQSRCLHRFPRHLNALVLDHGLCWRSFRASHAWYGDDIVITTTPSRLSTVCCTPFHWAIGALQPHSVLPCIHVLVVCRSCTSQIFAQTLPSRVWPAVSEETMGEIPLSVSTVFYDCRLRPRVSLRPFDVPGCFSPFSVLFPSRYFSCTEPFPLSDAATTSVLPWDSSLSLYSVVFSVLHLFPRASCVVFH
jgi:hypothetical protein